MNLYIIQYYRHFKNFLQQASSGDCFLNISKFTGQRIDYKSLLDQGVREFEIDHPDTNFYMMKPLERLIFCFKFKHLIRNNKQDFKFDKILIGNDGALQKIVIEEILKYNKNIVIEMWLDGLISLSGAKNSNSMKLFFSYLAEKIKLSFFLPSVIGTYSKVNKLYVMDMSVVNEYSSLWIKNKIKEINHVIFPRHIQLISQAKNKGGSPHHKIRVLYLTSAWGFHGHDKWQNYQSEQIDSLVNYFDSINDIDFKIRVHPRDSKQLYSVEIQKRFSNIPSFEEDIMTADVILSARSTGLFEGAMIGKTAIIFNEHFNDHFMNGFLRTLPSLNCIEELATDFQKRGYL